MQLESTAKNSAFKTEVFAHASEQTQHKIQSTLPDSTLVFGKTRPDQKKRTSVHPLSEATKFQQRNNAINTVLIS